ncbi:MAG: orotate phosphoribosyltransferase [Alphaproteobacteria bacterium]|nr:orotate phosphoribosyltransferase [Alphaproteobacteria bacterium]
MSHQRLVELLREKSVRRGAFTLASGKQSDLYVDVRQTSLHAEGSVLIGRAILARLRPDVVGVGGMTMGADPLACVASALSHLDGRGVHAFLIRKEPKGHGVERLVVGMGNFAPGAKVAIVEDTTTTGGSSIRAVEAARDAGLDVVQLITVVDREEGARERIAAYGLELEAITGRTELLA